MIGLPYSDPLALRNTHTRLGIVSGKLGEMGDLVKTCEECGRSFVPPRSSRFCSEACRYRQRDRRRYEVDPEGERAKSRAYYVANRERVIARVIASRLAKAGRENGMTAGSAAGRPKKEAVGRRD